MQRAISIFGALALLTATTTVATGAVTDVTGIVTHVHPASNIVKLNDGRQIYLEPGATFTVDGRQVSIDDIKPGMRVTVSGGREDTGQQQGAMQQGQMQQGQMQQGAAGLSTHPPVDASGTVASYDAQNHVVTFQDGRMLKLGPKASVWQQGQAASIRPGTQVFVRGAQPTGYRTAWDASTMPRHRMGTVVSVNPASALVVLSDGTVVKLKQATRVQSQGQAVSFADMRPGDEVVIVGRQMSAQAGDSAGMASPGPRPGGGQAGARTDTGAQTTQQSELSPFSSATFEADDIHLIRRHQAP